MISPNICVFCGAKNTIEKEFIELAAKCGEVIAKHNFGLVYGGSNSGMMAVLAKAAYAFGGKVVGIYPKVLHDKEPINYALTETMIVDSLFIRKEKMIEMSNVFLCLPGGVGTLDEIFEVLTLKILGVIDKPIILLNHNGYWNILVDMLKMMVQKGFLLSDSLNKFVLIDTIEEVIEYLNKSE